MSGIEFGLIAVGTVVFAVLSCALVLWVSGKW